MTSIDSDFLNLDLDFTWAGNFTTACTELLLYGIHGVLFVLAMHILACRKTTAKKALRIYTVAMALFGTTQVVISVAAAVVAVKRRNTNAPTSSCILRFLALVKCKAY
ncbi:hypothetical protein B0H16DRAFT_1749085 [Mycena metata]|uniref:Uncharacterized protein n=1 Tax=Mycena metata TaxID=1033252 RepID=A0AAD7GP38_9AGAR|nr:hypothetical protein B0H16DRAFT_1749085 [Mycena metata]